MNQRNVVLTAWSNRLFLNFWFFFSRKDVLFQGKMLFSQKNKFMKTRARNEQTRCHVASMDQSFALESPILAGSNVYYTFALFLFFQEKEKHTALVSKKNIL